MEENNAVFTIVDENNETKTASLITVAEIEGREYAVYSIDSDLDNCDVMVSRLIKNADGSDLLEDIIDEEERKKIHSIVKEILNV